MGWVFLFPLSFSFQIYRLVCRALAFGGPGRCMMQARTGQTENPCNLGRGRKREPRAAWMRSNGRKKERGVIIIITSYRKGFLLIMPEWNTCSSVRALCAYYLRHVVSEMLCLVQGKYQYCLHAVKRALTLPVCKTKNRTRTEQKRAVGRSHQLRAQRGAGPAKFRTYVPCASAICFVRIPL
jgi:hypothetical protein